MGTPMAQISPPFRILLVAVALLGAVWFVARMLLRPKNVAAAAAHAAEHHGVPPLDETLDFEPLPEDQMPL